MRRNVASALAAVVALLGACSPGDGDGGGDQPLSGSGSLTPTFEPADGAAGAASAGSTTVPPGGPASVAPTDRTGAATTVPGAPPPDPGAPPAAPPSSGATPAPGPSTSSMTDPAGDPTPAGTLTPRPAWADLAGGTLVTGGDTVELRVRLADQVPAAAPDDEHTMNIASFFDVDGDGVIDYELWVNLADNGWGPAFFDNVAGSADFGDDAGVAIEVVAHELVLRFPLARLGGARNLRWSLASEWGPYEAIGTPAMARDDAPDDDRAVQHPS